MTRSKDLFRYSLLALAATTLMACNDKNNPPPPPAPAPAPVPVVTPDTYVLTSSGKLVGFAVAAPNNVTSVTLAVPAAETLLGGDFRPADSKFYIVTKVTADGALKVYVADTTTGALGTAIPLLNNGTGAGGGTAGAAITLTGTSTKVGVDFNPVANALRIIDGNGVNIRTTLAAGNNTFIDAPISAGLAEAAYTNTFATTCQTDLFYINGNQLFLTAAPNGIATNAASPRLVGSFGVTGDANSGFDVRTTSTGNVLTTALKVGGAYSVYEISPATGASVANRGTIGGLGADNVLGLVATLPTTAPANAAGNMLAITAGTTQNLITFNRAPQGSPNKLCSTTAITGLTAGDVIVGADTRPATGVLTALAKNGTAGRLYTIDGGTAAATAVAALTTGGTAVTLTGSNFGVDFNPVPDRLRVVGDDGQNLRINVTDGTTTVDTALTSATGGAARSGVSAVGYTNSFTGGSGTSLFTTLYGLDSTTDALVRIGNDPANGVAADPGNPNSGIVNDIGALGVDIGAVNAFDVIASNGTALMAATVGTTSTLYTVNLVTGGATRVQDFTAPIVAMGPSAGTARTATVFGVTLTGNSLVSFAPATPGTVTTIGAIGVPAGETVIGLDFRPSIGPKNGQLVALTGAGKLYAVNPLTAAATLLSTLSGTGVLVAATDEHGIDFNPLPDRLRSISVNGNNLRSAVETGASASDATTTQTGIFGAGYTNAFTTAPSTTLYVLRSSGSADELARVGGNPGNGIAGDAGNPNSGVVTSIGALGFDTSAIGDIDLAGGQNGFVLAALQPSAGGLSGLYRIVLATGAATKIADIATGGDAVRGIAIQLR